MSRWGEFEDRPTSWVHHSAERRERAPRALRLLNAVDERGRSSLTNWLEALVDESFGGGELCSDTRGRRCSRSMPMTVRMGRAAREPGLS